jgi:hypothetical protein
VFSLQFELNVSELFSEAMRFKVYVSIIGFSDSGIY